MGETGPESTVPSASPGGEARANESLLRAEELLERMRARLDALEQVADAGDADTAVDALGEIAEIAKEIEAEINRARAKADARA